jgi:hypothetical protein
MESPASNDVHKLMSQIHWKRILIFGFLSEVAVFAVFIPATVLLGEQPGMYSAVIASLVMPFFFAMWATAKLKSRFVLQGMLVGAVGMLIYIGLTQAQPEPLLYIIAHALKLLGGGAGGFVIQKRTERELVPIQ